MSRIAGGGQVIGDQRDKLGRAPAMAASDLEQAGKALLSATDTAPARRTHVLKPTRRGWREAA